MQIAMLVLVHEIWPSNRYPCGLHPTLHLAASTGTSTCAADACWLPPQVSEPGAAVLDLAVAALAGAVLETW